VAEALVNPTVFPAIMLLRFPENQGKITIEHLPESCGFCGHLETGQPCCWPKENGNMFDQINHEALGKKTLKEKIIEGAIILAVVGVMIGIMLYALEMA
jgi:hypothetical protein